MRHPTFSFTLPPLKNMKAGRELSLEQSREFLADDEYLEITPRHLRFIFNIFHTTIWLFVELFGKIELKGGPI